MIKSQKLTKRLSTGKLVEFTLKKSGKRFLAHRVRLRNNTLVLRLFRVSLFNYDDLKPLVKKSIRVDDDIYNALQNLANKNDKYLTEIINSSVLNEIATNQIDIIRDSRFKHKITVYFTQKDYRHVQDVLRKLRNRRITGVTFSSLVRSILYKHLEIVQEIEHNMKLIEEVA